MLIFRSLCAAVLFFTFGSGMVYAFKQEPLTNEQQQTSQKKDKSNDSGHADPSSGMSSPADQADQAKGTEIRIPGIGKVGVLPKLDFGLELLYGANGNVKPEENMENPNGDVTIRGSIKHRF